MTATTAHAAQHGEPICPAASGPHADRLGAGGMGTGASGRRLLTLAGLTGIGYSLSWVAGLSIPAPSPKFTASGSAIVTALAGHGPAVITQFALTEGLPAIGLAIVSLALARAARQTGAARAARFAAIAGVTAAAISALQFALGVALAAASAPVAAHLLFETVNRLDGVKMLALAGLGLAGAATAALPRWLRGTGIALAAAITVSGVVYLLLLPGLALAAGPALILLLIFVTGTGLMAPHSGGE
jgi:hypothetical protein